MGPQQRKVLLFKDLGEEGLSGEDQARAKMRQVGRKGVTKVPSLLFDIELEDNAVEDAKPDDDVQDVLRQLKSLLQPWNAIELELNQQVQKANREAIEEGTKLDAHQLAEKLDLPGHTFKVRAALGGSWSGDCLRQLRHFFLTCSMTGSTGPVTYVIDPCFRDQFEIANPTKQYASILAELPREFVGTEDRVSAVVTLLSNEIKRSFQVRGATLPPWRHPASMLSKWRPRRSEDTPVGSSRPGASGSGGTSLNQQAKFVSGKVEISASSSTLEGVGKAAVGTDISQRHGGTHRGGAPSGEWPAAGGNKRARDRGLEPKYSSLLAAKLRGVTYSAQSAFPGLCSKTNHA